jgi:putative redox protein
VKASVTLDKGMAFSGVSGKEFSVRMDSGPAVGGGDSGFRPMQLLLISLGGCTGMDVLSILRKKRQDVTNFEVLLDAKQAEEHPRVFTHIDIKYIIRGRGIRPAAVERAIELSETKYCPAQAMLAKSAVIDHVYEIIEEE